MKALVKTSVQPTTLSKLISIFLLPSVASIPRIFLPSTYCSRNNFVSRAQICGVIELIYQSSNRLFTIFKNAKPPRIIRQIMNKVEKTNSFTSRLAPPFALIQKQILCQEPLTPCLPVGRRPLPNRGDGRLRGTRQFMKWACIIFKKKGGNATMRSHGVRTYG